MKLKPQLILASQSKYRAELLSRLQLAFDQIAADIDETPNKGENPKKLVKRLAKQKACAVQKSYPDAIIIGSDQVAAFSGKILGKPHTREKAIEQLNSFADKRVVFYTSVCIIYKNKKFEHVDETKVDFKNLSLQQIEHYVDNEDALNCAGSFKSEGLGISLFRQIKNDDPTALIGLPMVWVADILYELSLEL